MDKRTIYSKTGKGSLEISKKSIKLASDERQTLILVDGKSNAGEIEEKLSRVQPMRLRVIFDKLVELDLIREFVTKQGPDSLMPIPGNTAMAMQVQELDEGELDFTALAPTASANTVKEVEERRQAAQRAEEEAGRARAEVERQAAAAAARQAQEDALRRQADEAAARARADDEARLRAEADAKARIEEEARRKVEEENRREAQRRADEEAQRKLAEDAKRKAAEEAERRARDEARRKAEEEEARRRAEEEARQRAEAEARRQAEEAARRRAEEEARRKAEEEARQAEEAARRRAAEEAAARQRADEQRQRDEAERREREEAARRAAEDERRAAEERVRLLQEAEAREREDLERRQREEAEALLREQTERRAREEQEARERGRREEEAKRAAIAEEQRRRAAAVENAATAESRAADEAERRLAEEAARYTAALTPEIEAASAPASVDLDFAPAAGPKPLAGSGPDTFADTSGASSIMEAGLDDDLRAKKDIEKESRKELEQEAKENAKAAAKAKKDAEREAKRLAKESKVTVRRGGGIGFSLGKIIGIFVVLALAGGIGYLYFMPVDKALIEAAASARFGEPVRVGSAKFEPFPPQLKLSNVSIGDLNMPLVVAVPDPGSLAADKKIWKSIDISGITLDVAQARKFANLLLHDANRGTMVIQRIHVDKVSLTGTALPVPVFNANILLSASGEVKQAAFTLPDGKAQVQLVPDDKGWQGEFESRGILWPVGPKVAWESVRAKGVLTEGGIKFESIAITHFAGTAASAGELTWGRAWKYAGNLDVSGMETDLISTAFFGASQVSGTMDSKLTATLAAPTLAQLFDAPQLEGDVNVNKAMVKSLDLARTAQTGTQTSGPTRFTEYFTCSIASSGGRLTVKNVRGSSGLLSVTGEVGVGIEKSLSGVLNVEIGVSSNRTKAALKVSGTPADPKLTP